MKLTWSSRAWDEYVYWQGQDRKIVKRINLLIKDIERNGSAGLGKPEPLKHRFQGFWARRIDKEHRLVYKVEEDGIFIAQCRFHYEKLSPRPRYIGCSGAVAGL